MTNTERLSKLEQAVSLIREVEFSYLQGSTERSALYSWIAMQCSFIGYLGIAIQDLKRKCRDGED